jgi:tetratricopeptide (TPR) repeat protein/TolB-like protein
MADTSNKFSRFLLELKRRKTDRVLVMYAAAAFVILQLADILIGGLSLPDWIMTLIIIIVATGFPIAAIFSWIFDITPGGIEKTKPVTGIRKGKLEAQLRTWKEATMISLIIIIALIIFNIVRGNIYSSDIKRAEKTIAVLPFNNLTPNEIFPYTTDVITTIIIGGLREINLLHVCERWEVHEFKTKNRTLADIAKKLNVSFLVTGELVNSKDLVLVTINLVRASKKNAATIWTHNYTFDPKGSIAELNKIPIHIGNELKIVLSAEEKNRISKKPTVNTAAFFNYFEGTAYQDDAYNGSIYLSAGDSIFMDLSVKESFNKAMFFYDKAIMADSTFALAYAKRALTRAWGYNARHFGRDQMEKCRSDIEHALKYDNLLTDTKIAYGFYYYYFLQDYVKALEYFREVSVKEPKNWENKFYMAIVLRAQGEWEQSQAIIKEVVKNKLNNPLFLTNIGLSYHELHKYDSAIYYHEKAIEIMPKWSSPYQNKIESLVLRDGNTRNAEVVLDTAVKRTTGGFFQYIKIIFDMYNGRYKDALLKAEVADLADFPDQGSKYMVLADIYHNLKSNDMAREHYKSALEFYNEKVKNDSDNLDYLSFVGISAAGLNDRLKAVEAGQKAVKLAENNYSKKTTRTVYLAQIYTMIGEYDKALELLETLLKNPSDISIKLLQIDPVWKPLQEKSGFRKLIKDYSINP